MPSFDACLLDSNILLRISKSDDPRHASISQALRTLAGRKVRLCYTSQALGEFWNASTRPLDRNGFGLSTHETDRLARVIERDFEFLPDSQEVHDRWRALLVLHNIQGVQVHDARLAASMYVHGVRQLLTFNIRDFRRFAGLHVFQPNELVGSEQTGGRFE
jgi:predicted nucleic acid-binding protein